MSAWVYAVVQLPLSVSVLTIAAVSAGSAWLAVRLVRRIWPHPAFKENHELVGFTYSVYGLIYGVFLAFIIVVGWQRFAETEQLVMHEVTALSELWRDSLAFPPPLRTQIHENLIDYAESVLNEEWPAMSSRGEPSPHTAAIYEHLWMLAYHVTPETESQGAFLGEFLVRLNELSGDRRMRILHSRMAINSILWLVLLIGALPTMTFPLLFSNKHAWVQVTIVGCVMTLVLLGLLVTLSLQHPFSGPAGIRPVAFQDLLGSFHHRLLEEVEGVGP